MNYLELLIFIIASVIGIFLGVISAIAAFKILFGE
jgi:hypothetical protein